jgi:hypothetical protein
MDPSGPAPPGTSSIQLRISIIMDRSLVAPEAGLCLKALTAIKDVLML